MRVELVRGPIDEVAASREVEHAAHGAVLSFRGVVRNRHAGRSVTHIDYHAFEEMALAELRAVSAAAAERFEISALGVIHRIGIVRVLETSLFIAASAVHRRPVFEGVLWLVDELKRRVPIWKKEYGPEGQSWVEGVLPTVP